ncbi:MAG: UPF0489 family protein [Candidatus Solibacter sp.]|jgi:hypothetical protein
MHTILDLDLDFFVWPPFRDRPEEARLPRSEWEQLASEREVRSFLEERCHLSTRAPVQGCEAEQHQEAFNVWRQWIENESIVAPFNVVHADAHSDLGAGWPNRSCTFIETELLAMPIEERRCPAFGPDHLDSGNYLLGVIANRWISQLTYVYPADRMETAPGQPGSLPRFEDAMRELARLQRTDQEPPVSDLPAWIFRNNDWTTRHIELKHYHPARHRRSCADDQPVHTEPPVPFNCVEDRKFSLPGITHVFLADSPKYTPVEANELLPVIREYFFRV